MSGSQWYQRTVSIEGRGRGLHDITQHVRKTARGSGIFTGLCHLFIQHTSASLLIQENADPDVLLDLEDWFGRHVLDGDSRYRHTAEGPDDMSAHIRTALTQTSLTVPIVRTALALGTWQGIYLFEHRTARHDRKVVITIHGEREPAV